MPRPKHDASIQAVAEFALDGLRPKGEQIRDALAAFVQSARPGMLLPSERVLSERLGVARMTVRNCIEDLEGQGYVRRVPGRGTFVRERRLVHSDIFRSFSDDMRLRGMEPGSRRLVARIRPATRQIADRLGIPTGDRIIYIERVRTADGIPMALERTNLSAARFPGLNKALDLNASLYEVLGRAYGVRLDSAEQRISITRLTAREAEQLEIGEDVPALLIERLSLDNMGNVVEFGRSLYRGDRYEIRMHVSRPATQNYHPAP